MKEILDEMEEHIAAIRNLQRNFDYHSKSLEKLMKHLSNYEAKTIEEEKDTMSIENSLKRKT